MKTDSECISGLEDAAEDYGPKVTERQYRSGDYSPSITTIKRRFGGWNAAKEKVGLDAIVGGVSRDVNESYFSEIDNQEKAYWLGFLYGDGSVNKNSSGTLYVTLEIDSDDDEILREFRDDIELDKEVYEMASGTSAVSITGDEFVGNLESHGLTQDKTKSESTPNLESDVVRAAFIRGLIDADGYFDRSGSRVKITGSNKERFEKLSEWIPVKTRVHEVSDGSNVWYDLSLGNVESFSTLINWLYPNGVETEPALERKKPQQ